MSAARRRENIKRGWGDDLPSIPVSKIDAELYGALREVEGDQLILQDGQIRMGAFTLTATGLEMIEQPTQDEWSRMGEVLFRLEGSIQWLLGDWLAYGEDVHYGEVEEIAQRLDRDYGTLRNYASISRKVHLSLRNDKLSYHHHVAAAILPPHDQAYALTYAAENKLSVVAFRKWIKEQQGGNQDQPALPDGDPFDIDTPVRGFKKFLQRDPSSLKPKERSEVIGYMTEMERMIADYRRRMGIE